MSPAIHKSPTKSKSIPEATKGIVEAHRPPAVVPALQTASLAQHHDNHSSPSADEHQQQQTPPPLIAPLIHLTTTATAATTGNDSSSTFDLDEMNDDCDDNDNRGLTTIDLHDDQQHQPMNSLTGQNGNSHLVEHSNHQPAAKGGLPEILKSLDVLKTSLSSLSSDVHSELETVKSSNVESITTRFESSLSQLTQIQSLLLDHSRTRDLWMISTVPGTPLNGLSPTNHANHKNKELTNKMDDLLARLKEATQLPPEALTARPTARPLDTKRGCDANDFRGNSWEDDMEKKVIEELNFVTNAIDNVERASQLEAEVKQLRAQLAVAQSSQQEGMSILPPIISSQVSSETETAILLEEARVKRRWLEAMQSGSWFFRIARKFGPLGKALKALQRRRVFIRLSPDFRFLSISNAEPKAEDPDGVNHEKPPKSIIIALDNVEAFEYGSRSRAYRLLEEARNDTDHPSHLCVSFHTSKVMVDLIALNDADIEKWVLGLNCLIPFFPGRQFFTSVEFTQQKTALREEFFRTMDGNNNKQQPRSPPRKAKSNGQNEIEQ